MIKHTDGIIPLRSSVNTVTNCEFCKTRDTSGSTSCLSAYLKEIYGIELISRHWNKGSSSYVNV
jgi:hypothetical protein